MQEVISPSLIAQVSHFTMSKRLLVITHLFQFSRLFHSGEQKSAVAIAVLIINPYNRRAVLTAQNADVAPTIVGVTYSRFMKNVKTDACALYAHHRPWQQNLISHKSLFCRGHTLNFVECDPGQHKTTKVQSMRFVCCAQMCFWLLHKRLVCFSLKTLFPHCTLTLRGPHVRLRGEHALSEVSAWLMFGRRNLDLVLPRGFSVRLL